jgi:hypothetical protein
MFHLSAEDRLRSWREFRANIDSLPIKEALDQTAEYWSRAPFVPYNLDINHPESWPNPWTLICENVYCDIAKCLGIVYTLCLTHHFDDSQIEIRIYKDLVTGYQYNLVWIEQGKYILNMIDSQVVNIKQLDKNFKLIKNISTKELQVEL